MATSPGNLLPASHRPAAALLSLPRTQVSSDPPLHAGSPPTLQPREGPSRSALGTEGPWPRPPPCLWASGHALLFPPAQNPGDQKPHPPKGKVTGPSEPGCVGALPILIKLTGFGSYLLTSLTLAYPDGYSNRVVVEIII